MLKFTVEMDAFRTGSGSISANISGGRGQFPVTPFGVERLEISLFRMVFRLLADDYFVLSQHTHLTDGQTDRIATAIPCVALHAVPCCGTLCRRTDDSTGDDAY